MVHKNLEGAVVEGGRGEHGHATIVLRDGTRISLSADERFALVQTGGLEGAPSHFIDPAPLRLTKKGASYVAQLLAERA